MTQVLTRRSSARSRRCIALVALTVVIGLAGLAPAGADAAGTARASATRPTRSLRAAVVLLHLSGASSVSVSKAAMQAVMFAGSKSVANWYSQTSGGQLAVTGTVFGYYAGVRSCDLATELNAGAAAAAADGYVAADYTNLIVYAPSQACDFSGMGWIGGNGVFLNGNAGAGLIEHELGHNLGLLHAGAYACGAAPVSGGCLLEYADPTDVMGDTALDHEFSAEHKYMLGWIPAPEVRTVTSGTHTIALTAEEDPLVAGATELIHVRAADGTLFAIDRRVSAGYDVGVGGVWIRQVAAVRTDDTELVRSGALAAGETFVDAAHDVSVTTLTDSGATASVRVCVGPCAAPVSAQSLAALGPVAARNVTTASKISPHNASISLTVPTGRGVGVGRTVIVVAVASGAAGSVSCDDSRGDTYGVNVNSVGAERLIVCSARATRGLRPGAVITIRYPGFSGSTVASVNDFSGIRATSRADKTSARGANTLAVDSGPTARTASAHELVFAVLVHRGAANAKAGASYTSVGAVTHGAGATALTIDPGFKVVSSPGAFELRGVLPSRQQWRAAVVTFFRA